MKLFIFMVMFLNVTGIQYSFAQTGATDNLAVAAQKITISHMLKIFDASKIDPIAGTIDIELFKENIQKSIDAVSKMKLSSEKTILEMANTNLVAISSLIETKKFGTEQIKGFYANLKAQQ